jgi:Pretoxin HINT domain
MLSTLILGVGLLAANPVESAISSPEELAAYESARKSAGRDTAGQVKLALWCEAHGLSAERVKHLALAVLSDPRNATARGLLGLVDHGGRWARPEDVSANVQADTELTAKLADYNARREHAADTVDAQWKLAQWCEQAGLKPEALAHLSRVVKLDPNHDAARKRLGFKKQGNRWVTDAELADEKAEVTAQRKAEHHWKPLLTKWRNWLREGDPRGESSLATVSDSRAVPLVWSLFAAVDDAKLQSKAIEIFGRTDGAGASRALAILAVSGSTPETRRAALETLRRRDPREFVGMLVGTIRTPLKYEVRPVAGPNSPGELFVEGERYNVRRVYGVNANQLPTIPPRLFDASVPFDPFSAETAMTAAGPASVATSKGPATNLTAAGARRDMQIANALVTANQIVAISQQQLQNDVQTIETMNADANAVNDRVIPALHVVTGQDLGASSEKWQAWWTDQKGYAIQSAPTQEKPTFTEFVANPYAPPRHACFGAGTPVRTLTGPRPIETIQVGDQVLTQDATSGRLSFQPVVTAYHNPPARTLRVAMGGETLVVTGIHRFWKAGSGWVMARDLKPGDVLRSVGGTTRVESVEDATVQPVFNLEVTAAHSYFVGNTGALVHDNSIVQPVAAPFDARPSE